MKGFPNMTFQIIPFLNPFIFDEMNRMGNYCGINSEKNRETPVVVSLTSRRERFGTLDITLYSLLNQSFKPDKVILWLSDDTEDLTTIPYEITRYIKNGLEVRFVRDIKSYTKSIYAFKEFGQSIVVTVSDNIYYRKDWLKRLYHSYIAMPECIHVHLAKLVAKSGAENFIFCGNGRQYVKEATVSYSNFLCGEGGVLYPPNCFTREVYREDIFCKHIPDADDCWFWVMALVHNKKICVVKNHYKELIVLDFTKRVRDIFRWKNCCVLSEEQCSVLMKYYGQNVLPKLGN